MGIRVNQSDLRKVNKLFSGLNKATTSELNRIVDINGLKIVREIKKPPIPVDTGNLRNNVVYDALKKQIQSNAPYSGFLEFGTRFQEAQPYFFSKIITGLKILMLDLNNAIKRSFR